MGDRLLGLSNDALIQESLPDQGLDGREGLEMLNMGSENLGESEVSPGKDI